MPASGRLRIARPGLPAQAQRPVCAANQRCNDGCSLKTADIIGARQAGALPGPFALAGCRSSAQAGTPVPLVISAQVENPPDPFPPSWLVAQASRLCRRGRAPSLNPKPYGQKKTPARPCGSGGCFLECSNLSGSCSNCSGGGLPSHTLSGAVFSLLTRFTVVFGMGTGGSTSPCHQSCKGASPCEDAL